MKTIFFLFLNLYFLKTEIFQKFNMIKNIPLGIDTQIKIKVKKIKGMYRYTLIT
jgi:hypothetical protein